MKSTVYLVCLNVFMFMNSAALAKIVPDDLEIPNTQLLKMQSPPSEYLEIFERLKHIFSAELNSAGAKLKMKFDLENTRVNAFVTREDNHWLITFLGGMIRHRLFNNDLFSSVLCHELGHHLAGAPTKYPDDSEKFWVSTEGQADYFTTNICLKRLYMKADNQGFIKDKEITNYMKEGCSLYHLRDKEYHLCLRNSYLAVQTAMFSYRLTWGRRGPRYKAPVLDEPDTSVVSRTQVDHPEPQCRLDTFFQGSLCPLNISRANTSAYQNCHESDSRSSTFLVQRPKCWFAGE